MSNFSSALAACSSLSHNQRSDSASSATSTAVSSAVRLVLKPAQALIVSIKSFRRVRSFFYVDSLSFFIAVSLGCDYLVRIAPLTTRMPRLAMVLLMKFHACAFDLCPLNRIS